MEPGAKNPNAKQVCSSGSIASDRSQVSTMPDAKLWSLSLLPEAYQRSMDAWAEARPWIDPTAVDLPSCLQNVGAGLRGQSVNPAIRFARIIRNKLDGDG